MIPTSMSSLRGSLAVLYVLCSLQLVAQLRLVEGERSLNQIYQAGSYQAINSDLWVDVKVSGQSSGLKSRNTKSNDCGNIAFDPVMIRACRDNDFTVVSSGFTAESQDAFQYALELWSRTLNLTVPLKVNAEWVPLAPGVLGSANATWIWNLGDSLTYPSALADQLVGEDIHTQSQFSPSDPWYDAPDMEVRFNSDFPDWYFGLDGCPGPNQIDFVTVVMHEIGHGLGFFSSTRYFPPLTPIPELMNAAFFEDVFCVGFGAPFIFDTFLESGVATLGQDDCFFEDGFLTSDQLVFTGPEAMSCFGGPVQMYAPPFYTPGSSVSHFDEGRVTPGSINALLTPFIDRGEAVHDPGCGLAVLRDLGYNTEDQVTGCPIPTIGEWGIIHLTLILLIMMVVLLQPKTERGVTYNA